MRAASWITAALAVVVCAWFALGVRQAHDTDQATAIISSGARPSGAEARRAESLLHAAKELNPDSAVDVLRARLSLEQGNPLLARTILERVVGREPRNALAWEWLALTWPRYSVGAYVATGRVHVLVPPIRAHTAR